MWKHVAPGLMHLGTLGMRTREAETLLGPDLFHRSLDCSGQTRLIVGFGIQSFE